MNFGASKKQPAGGSSTGKRWSDEKVWNWYNKTGWLVGTNYCPSTACNALEFWQRDTFDPETIERELGWAEAIGANLLRVFLHYMAWEQDKDGFLSRVDQFLSIAHRHGLRTMLVLHDDVWDPNPKPGPQPDPTPRRILSGWVQCPGRHGLENEKLQDSVLKQYVQSVIARFRNDERVVIWDLYNEPGNNNGIPYGHVELPNKVHYTERYLRKVYSWARQVQPSQPLTAALFIIDDVFAAMVNEKLENVEFFQFNGINNFIISQSDVLTFHCYEPLDGFQDYVAKLKVHNRPLICTEFLARTIDSTIQDIMPYAKQNNIGVTHWGFVKGKTNEIYPWDSWAIAYDEEPDPWFHTIFHTDGRPYDQEEIEVYKKCTGKNSAKL